MSFNGAEPARVTTAFVLGAGLGTRLRTLTARLPKPLVPLAGRPLITFAFDHLLAAGVTKLVVNTHHCAEAYERAFPDSSYRGVPIFFRHEPVLLETGGGIKNVEDLVGDAPFLVYNGDVLTSLPLAPLLAQHATTGAEVTLALRSAGGPLQVALDRCKSRVVDIAARAAGIAGQFLFTGVYVVNPAFLRRLMPGAKVSVIPIFLEMIAQGVAPGGVVLDMGEWWDLGTRDQYLDAHRRMDHYLHPDAALAPGVALHGAAAIGAGARVGAGASLTDCVLWENACVAAGSVLERCVVTEGAQAAGTHADADF